MFHLSIRLSEGNPSLGTRHQICHSNETKLGKVFPFHKAGSCSINYKETVQFHPALVNNHIKERKTPRLHIMHPTAYMAIVSTILFIALITFARLLLSPTERVHTLITSARCRSVSQARKVSRILIRVDIGEADPGVLGFVEPVVIS
jgi:hypothetical protein